MRFSIHTLGTRGDIQPYLALSRGLKARGHDEPRRVFRRPQLLIGWGYDEQDDEQVLA